MIQHIDRLDPRPIAMDGRDAVAQIQLSAANQHPRGGLLPHLPGAELRVEKALDQTRLGAFLRGVRDGPEGFGQCMPERFADRKAFDALRAPFRRDLRAGYSPDLLGGVLEEGAVELVAKAVDQEVLEGDSGERGARRARM